MEKKRVLVVGAGFAGATIARVLYDTGYDVKVIDKRNHICGNAYDYINEYGIKIHKYGPHLFHTNNEEVFNFLSKFTDWTEYIHKVKAKVNNEYVPFPVNHDTLKVVPKEKVFETFFEPYSKKMWGKYYSEIIKDVFDRVKTRDSNDDRWFTDKYQVIPTKGYEFLFKNMLKNIDVELNRKFNKLIDVDYDHIFTSMSIDEYYNYKFGELPYRSIKFHNVTLPTEKYLPCTTVNFTRHSKCTRITEWKQIPEHGYNSDYTTLTYEEPCNYKETNEKDYPVPTEKNKEIYKKYKSIVNDKVTFIGRCGLYVYIDMHQAVSSSLAIAKKFMEEDE